MGDHTPESVRLRIIALRDELTARGLDAGADTIAAHLSREKTRLSRTTIWRILTATGKVSPQPQKRPRSSWRRFAADRPNELWQSDFTHVTLTDNGVVYTTRLARGGRGRGDGAGNGNGFETLLAGLGITQKNGKPFNPTTQGKIERFWQTLKKYLHAHPAASLTQLQTTLDTFRDYYNNTRPHRGIGRRTPAFAYELIPKAAPTRPADPNIWRVRYDTIDNDRKITLRRSGRLLHLGIGRAHARTEIICLVHNSNATIITLNTGELIAEFTLDPTKNYQRKNG
ncbi:integrase core domain-containing protein [Microbacterium esteraromaticum]|uniref:integrase core domain-containing protein n=1 Tax=Microbacterium esteraromaticum TaxID=57043 RepID=UPI0023675250|nr:integrase core domain-containing protein [Microbacterium esteraromaticum]WDH79293.1 integrase core domain-containing protein [Microbacterium esteraromaticum]